MANLRAQQDAPRPQTLLESKIGEIESRLKSLVEAERRIGAAINRLINPRPADVATGAESMPPPATIEGQLQNIVRQLDILVGELSGHAETLDSAI